MPDICRRNRLGEKGGGVGRRGEDCPPEKKTGKIAGTDILRGVNDMVTAVVLINVERAQVNEVAEALLELKGISEVYSVGGRYDLVAVIRASDNEQLAALVTREMLKLKGISKTETLIAFRAYSRHDLESMFSVGMEEVPPSKKRA